MKDWTSKQRRKWW